jgi:hypothetical protein
MRHPVTNVNVVSALDGRRQRQKFGSFSFLAWSALSRSQCYGPDARAFRLSAPRAIRRRRRFADGAAGVSALRGGGAILTGTVVNKFLATIDQGSNWSGIFLVCDASRHRVGTLQHVERRIESRVARSLDDALGDDVADAIEHEADQNFGARRPSLGRTALELVEMRRQSFSAAPTLRSSSVYEAGVAATVVCELSMLS